jgi:hypothetical protein
MAYKNLDWNDVGKGCHIFIKSQINGLEYLIVNDASIEQIISSIASIDKAHQMGKEYINKKYQEEYFGKVKELLEKYSR